MATTPTTIQTKINGPVTNENSIFIIDSILGDGVRFEYNNPPALEHIKNYFYGVPTENKTFVHRPNIIAIMEAALTDNLASGGCRIIALVGLGGMGKTQLMLRYCYLRREAYDYIFWLEVNTWRTAIDSFRKLAINLGFKDSTMEKDSEEQASEEKVINWVRSWFQMRTKWLLLLDNANGDEMNKEVFKLLPRIGGNIIITTRMHIPSNMATVIHIGKMEREEAISLMLETPADSVDQKSIKFRYIQEIVTLLDCMPLAVDLARAYVKNTETSFRRYLSIFKTKHNILFQFTDEDGPGQYEHNIATVWQLSLERIRIQNPTAVKILEVCAFLQPEKIPAQLLEKQCFILELGPCLSTSPPSEERETSQDVIREAIAVLVKFSFVTRIWREVEDREEDPSSDLLTIHRLVQKVVYDTIKSDERRSWALRIATALNRETDLSSYDSYSSQTRNIMDTYLSHMRQFITMIDDFSQRPLLSKDLCELLNRNLDYLLDHKLFLGVEEIAKLAIRISEVVYEPNHPDAANSLSYLAGLYYRQGKYNEAEPLYLQVLEIREKVLGSEHLSTSASLSDLASLNFRQGKYGEAESLCKRALTIRKKVLGLDHPHTAASLNNLAGIYESQGRYDKAEPTYQQALAIIENLLGLEHPYLATSLDDLAGLYFRQGKYGEADSLYHQALAIREKALGLEHLDTAVSLNNLAGHYCFQGKHEVAESLYQKVLAIREKVLGPEHPDTAALLNNLAGLSYRQGKYDAAAPLFKRALAIKEKMLGSMHPSTATSLNNIAVILEIQSKYDEAEPLYQRALAIREKILGSDHPDTAKSLNNLAGLYMKQRKHNEAELLYQRALAIKEKILGSEHVETATSLNDMASFYESQGKCDEAELLYRRALVIYENMLGTEHSYTATSLNNLAGLYSRQGKYDEAESLFKRSLAINEKLFGSIHSSTATLVHNLARFYFFQDKYDEAEQLYKRAVAIREQVLGPDHPHTLKSKYCCSRAESFK